MHARLSLAYDIAPWSLSVKPILTTDEAADYTSFSKRTLENWRRNGGGPQYSKIGRSVRYRREDLDAFLESHLKTSTSA
jgi:excisionase family DNA binding protein